MLIVVLCKCSLSVVCCRAVYCSSCCCAVDAAVCGVLLVLLSVAAVDCS